MGDETVQPEIRNNKGATMLNAPAWQPRFFPTAPPAAGTLRASGLSGRDR